MTSSAVRDQVMTQLKKAMKKAREQRDEMLMESIQAEMNRANKGRAA